MSMVSFNGLRRIDAFTGLSTRMWRGTEAGAGHALTALVLAGMLSLPAFAFRAEEGQAELRAAAAAVPQAAPVREPSAQQVIAAESAGRAGVKVEWHSRLDTPASVRGADLGRRQAFSGGRGLLLKGGGAFQDDAIAVLDNLAPLFRISDAAKEFSVSSVQPDKIGFRHVRLAQTHRGLRVVGRDMIVHFNAQGVAYEVNGRYEPDVNLAVTPKLTVAEVARIARADLTGGGHPRGELAREPELVVFALDSEPRLAYELTLSYRDAQAGAGQWRYWVDALQGGVLLRFNNIQRIDAPTTNGIPALITGNVLPREGGGVTNVMGWSQNDGNFYLYNTTRNWTIYNAAYFGYEDAGTYANRATADWADSDPAEISAAFNLDLIQKYYLDVHGRNSYDAKGTNSPAYVHEGFFMANAYWDGTAMHIGDGDGEHSDNLAVLDVFAHEYTHAVTDVTANLTYRNESGALNESFSDIFGVCAEFFGQVDDGASYPEIHPGQADWLMGEDCWVSSPALRDMRNPANAETVGEGNEQPTLYKGSYWYSGTGDNGGVHQNSGVQNFFFYLLSEGGSGTNEGFVYNVTGIGITNAEQVAYRTLTVYCTPNTDYQAARLAWISAAQDLNTNWVRSVKQAWNAVLGRPPPRIFTLSTLPAGRVGTPYSYQLGVVGGESPYTWELVAGSLPPALTFNNGVVSGMPEAEGTFEFGVEVEDDIGVICTNAFSLTILPVFGAPFTETFESGGVLPDGWSQEFLTNKTDWTYLDGGSKGHPAAAHGGAYNACLAITTPSKAITRLVSPRIDFGPAPRAGQLTFWHYMEKFVDDQDELRIYYKTGVDQPWILLQTYTASINQWRKQTVDLPEPCQTYYIAFEGTAKYGYGVYIDDVYVFDPIPPLGITTPSPLPEAVIDIPYTQALTAVGGTLPYTFTLASGALPPGLTLSADGVISGSAPDVGSSAFEVTVTDAGSLTATAAMSLTVTLPKVALFEETFEHSGQMPFGWTQEYVTNTVSWRFQSGGGDGNDFNTPSGPHGGAFNAVLWTGPSYADHKTRLVTPAINLGAAPASVRLTFWHCMVADRTIQDELLVFYKTSATGAWNLLATYTQDVPVWTQRSLEIPDPTSTYYIAFEGNAKFAEGVCIDDVKITDEASAPIITTATPLPVGFVNVPYSLALAALGGIAPYSWSVVSNNLPAGLTLSDAGVISGTPSNTVLATFVVRVTGTDGYASENLLKLQVKQLPGFPFTETFETNGLPVGWTQELLIGNATWSFRSGSPRGTPPAAHGGLTNACLYYAGSSYNINKLVSPMLNLGVGTPNTQLSFWMCMAGESGNLDQLRVYYKASAGANWTQLGTSFTKEIRAWTNIVLALPNPSPTYFIAFEGWAKFGQGVCIDDVAVTGDFASPYDSWKSEHFTEAEVAEGLITGDEDDPDGDGVVNALEYAMGLDPRVAGTEGVPYGGVSAGYLTLTHRESKEATDVRFEVEACTSLVANDWSTNGVSTVAREDSNTWWNVTSRHDVPVTNAPQRFLRLKVWMP